MLGFGVVVVDSFVRALRGRAVDWRPARIVGLAYLVFGAGALVASGGRLFLLVPGLLILAGARDEGPPAG